MDDDRDIWVDFITMTDDRRLWATLRSARPGFAPIAGRYAVVGNDDADPAVGRILLVNAEGHIELEVLAGSADSHRHLLDPS